MNTQLSQIYQVFNERFFENLLPSDCRVSYSRSLGETQGETLGEVRCQLNPPKIFISWDIHRWQSLVLMTLLHEMCHLWVWVNFHAPPWEPSHGDLFQSRMLALAKAGAFSEWW